MLRKGNLFFLLVLPLLTISIASASRPEETPPGLAPTSPSTIGSNYFSVVNTYFSRFLHQGTTLSILHTSNQRLWISNYDGVLQAKGKSIQYQNELFASTSGFYKPRIRKLVEVWNNKVLAVTDSNEPLVYDEKLGVFTAPAWINSLGAVNPKISDVYFSSEALLLIGLMSGEVIQIHEDGRVERADSIDFDKPVTDFHEDSNNGIFLAASTGRIFKGDFGSDHIQIYDIEVLCGKTAPAQEVAQIPTGGIWIGTIGGGLLSIDEETNQCRQVDSGIDTQKDFHRSTIHDITFDKDTGHSIVSSDQGIFIFKDDLVVQNFTTSNSKLSNNEVISLAPDYSGGYWVGTYNGINRLVFSPFELFDRQTHDGLHSVIAFESISDSQILVASYSGLMVTDVESGTFSAFKHHFPDISIYGERIMSVFADEYEIYLGYRNSGFEILNLSEPSSSRLNTDILDGLASNSISAFLKLDSERMLIGTYGGGLTIFKKPNFSESITSGDTHRDLRDDRVLMLFRSSDNTVWVGTESGLQIFNLELHQFQDITFESTGLETPNQPIIWSMAETQDYIWFGSLHHGLFKLDKNVRIRELSTVVLEHVEITSPFSGKTVYAIEAGSQGEIWFSTNRGISRLAKDGSLLNFGHTHGLQETEFELGSSYKDTSGFIYFGGNHGYNRFDPSDVIAAGKPSGIALNSIILDGEDVIPLPPTSAFDSIVLNHTDRFITFEFSALDFTDPESTRYRHKLVGFDKDWVDVGNRGSATYTNLPAGDYIFRVQAVNSAGIWNYDGLTIDLRVAPAPWLTGWAFSAYFILFLGAASLFLKFYRNYMLKEQQLQQANEMQRVADRFADELQDQIDFQSKLTDSIHSYNKQLLYWAGFCTDTTLEYEPGATELAHKRVRFRLEVLDVVQDSLYYQGERLYANLHDCADRLANALCSRHPHLCNRLTVVNDIQQELVPAAQAIPIAIILAELFDNSLTHGFDAERSSCFVRFSVTYTPSPGANSDTARFIYQDNGIGIPPGLAFESPEAAGFAIIKRAGEVLGCELAIGREDRSMVTASFLLPWS